MSPMNMTLTHHLLASTVLILAGVYQFTPWKESYLKHCQSPMQFLTERRRPGLKGAFLMGIDHGAYCLGCCWFLMALLFVGGIMNLYWIIGLTIYVLMEKLILNQLWSKLSKLMGLVLVFSGVGLLLNQWLS